MNATRSRHGVLRSHARSTTYTRSASSPTRASDVAMSRLLRRVEQDHVREPQQGVDRLGMAVRCPHDGREPAHEVRIHDRVEMHQLVGGEVERDVFPVAGFAAGLRGRHAQMMVNDGW